MSKAEGGARRDLISRSRKIPPANANCETITVGRGSAGGHLHRADPSGDARRERRQEENDMTLCPIAIAAGCKKCPAFSVCPLKGIIGDYHKDADAKTGPQSGKGKSAAKSSK
jgi:hypothetical protein